MALLVAVAAQVGTALENGRLYQQLRLQADEVERMRQFNENILESLDDGLAVVDENDRVVRWNRALEVMCDLTRDRGRRPLPLMTCCRRRWWTRSGSARLDSPGGRVALPCAAGHSAGGVRTRDPRQHRDRAAAGTPRQRGDRWVDSGVRGRDRAGPPRRAAADCRQDGVNRPAGGWCRARSEHTAHRASPATPRCCSRRPTPNRRTRSCSRRSSARPSARRRS